MRFVRLVAAVALIVASAPAALAAELTDTGHVPGDVGFGVDLPADTEWEGEAGKTHPCAGRKLLYHSHNDALYGTSVEGELKVMAVDGQQVVDQDAICFRLPRDADAEGNEVSRIQIPDDGSLDFLGTPGGSVWIAPQSVEWSDNWRPIWSGIGAFDPAHEGDPEAIPSNYKDDLMYFDLTEMEGPGDVQIFFKNAISPAEILFNSADLAARSVEYEVGGHGHFNWTFSKPGIYAMTWQGRAVLDDGTSQLTDPITQYWLVGDDSDVGLADGTTTELREVKHYVGGDKGKPAEPSTSVEPAPTEPSVPPAPAEPTPSASAKPAPDARCEAASALRTKPSALISSGHMDMGLVDEGGLAAKLIDDSDPRAPTPRDSGTFLFEVPDPAKTEIPANFRSTFPGEPESMWVLPQAQVKGLPWLGFSTTRLSGDSLQQGSKITVTMRDVRGPGRIFTWHEGVGGAKLELDSGDSSRTLEYGLNDHDHQAFGFTKAGFYSATFRFAGTDAAGVPFSKDLTATFAVGDGAVQQAREYAANGYAALDGVDLDACGTTATEQTGEPDSWMGALAKGIRDIDKEFASFGEKAGPFFAHLLGRSGKAESATQTATPRSTTAAARKTAAAQRPAEQKSATQTARRALAQEKPAEHAKPTAQKKPSGQAKKTAQAKPSVTASAKQAAKAATSAASTSTATAGGGIVSSFDGTDPNSLNAAEDDADEQQIVAAQGITAGGFWGGLILGVGLMALLGGIVLFAAAAKMLRHASGKSPRRDLEYAPTTS
ncbi:ABC transporter permease protein [Corynebacterium imitans]|uniref:ABC transporter permease protein n=1 Tax=Corynebacterium imitans TaxID=156978 RepID=A0A239YHK9_9CORY|nr:choice-of-anchor M domain-containing protein [Corynebacterium imitans]SNV57718.1 ABC transporter permease protein [Corynebacterium imitans]